MEVEFLNLQKINKRFEAKLTEVFLAFLESGYYILGNNVTAFENEFATYCNVKSCIGVGNGLDALTLILKGYIELGKLKKGDKVLVAANTYIATVLAITHSGLTPVLCEPNINSYNLEVKNLESNYSKDVKAVLVTHLYGQLADMSSLRTFTTNNNLLLISDSAQAHGARNILGHKAGSLADASAFSFYPTKNLGALADGGAVTTDNRKLAKCIKQLRNYGASSKYVNPYIGVNSRLDEIQAAFLREKLKMLDQDNAQRREIAKMYLTEIKNDKIELPYWDKGDNHIFHLFVVKVQDRKDFQRYLNYKGVQTLIHYPIPVYKQEAYRGVFIGNYPITDSISNQVISLPLSPIHTAAQVNYVIKVLNNY